MNRYAYEENNSLDSRPKFPSPQYLINLLENYEKSNDIEKLEMAEDALEKLYKSGIFDHIGYGFFGYSNDDKWLVPQFEKTLSDNALLGIAYTKIFQITGKNLYKEVAEKVYEFVIRDLLDKNGGFYSGIDADSTGVEGEYYLFTYDEINGLLGDEWGELFNSYYDITKEGNFEGRNIPNLMKTDIEDVEREPSLNSMVQMLFTYREERARLHRDENILISWNELIIGSLSYAGNVFGNDFYIKKANNAAEFFNKPPFLQHEIRILQEAKWYTED